MKIKRSGFMKYKVMHFASLFLSFLMSTGIYDTHAMPETNSRLELSAPLVMDPLETTLRLALYAPITIDEAYQIARKLSEENGVHRNFNKIFSKEKRCYFFSLDWPPNKKQGEPIREWGVYVDSETGQAQYVDSKRIFASPACCSEYERGCLGGQLRLLNSMYNKGKLDN